jgi:hypothetical protein
MASEPVAMTRRSRQRWLLIGIPVLLLAGRGANALVQLVRGDVQPDRLVLYIGLSVLSIVAALALLAGRRFGWLLAMGFIGADLAGEILLWYWGTPDYTAMALLALCAALITSSEMRATYVDGTRR